jgi:hypothetical protein
VELWAGGLWCVEKQRYGATVADVILQAETDSRKIQRYPEAIAGNISACQALSDNFPDEFSRVRYLLNLEEP